MIYKTLKKNVKKSKSSKGLLILGVSYGTQIIIFINVKLYLILIKNTVFIK